LAGWQSKRRVPKVIIREQKAGNTSFVHFDDVLTAEIVRAYKARGATLVMIRRGAEVRFMGRENNAPYSHAYPPVEVAREVPLMKLLVELEIKFGADSQIKEIPQDWLKRKSHVRPLQTREERLQKEQKRREEALFAAARRVLDKKAAGIRASLIEDEANAAIALSEDRECDVW